MVSYRQRRASYAWIVGILVFILAMTITFADVFGLDRFDQTSPGYNPGGTDATILGVTMDEWQNLAFTSEGGYYDPTLPVSVVTPSIPEPTTLALFVLGCGALLAGKRKAKL